MICVSLANITYETCIEVLRNEPFAEIRIDQLMLDDEQLIDVFDKPVRLIATCRQGKYSDQERLSLLKKAIEAGADYVDVEIEAEQSYMMELIDHARVNHCKVIVSYHNFELTPSMQELNEITAMCFDHGADIAKIVTTINDVKDRARIFGLYNDFDHLVAFGMGEMGKLTRVVSLELGAPYTYASLPGGNVVAPGQMDKEVLKEKIGLLQFND